MHYALSDEGGENRIAAHLIKSMYSNHLDRIEFETLALASNCAIISSNSQPGELFIYRFDRTKLNHPIIIVGKNGSGFHSPM